MAIRISYIHTLVLLYIMYLVQRSVVAAPASETMTESKFGQRGNFLYELGTNFSSPLLRLLGKTFQSYEDDIKTIDERVKEMCRMHPCTEWGSWTECPVDTGFSMVTRSRNCSTDSGPCRSSDHSDLPTQESKVCEGERRCPNNICEVGGRCPYNFTGGYCLKLFTTKLSQYEAQEVCQRDGAHLVNIDTKKKSDAFHDLIESYSIGDDEVWINGNRTNAGGDWQFTYGSTPDFDNWRSTEPSNGKNELCKVDDGSDRTWWDRECTSAYYYACEWVN